MQSGVAREECAVNKSFRSGAVFERAVICRGSFLTAFLGWLMDVPRPCPKTGPSPPRQSARARNSHCGWQRAGRKWRLYFGTIPDCLIKRAQSKSSWMAIPGRSGRGIAPFGIVPRLFDHRCARSILTSDISHVNSERNFNRFRSGGDVLICEVVFLPNKPCESSRLVHTGALNDSFVEPRLTVAGVLAAELPLIFNTF